MHIVTRKELIAMPTGVLYAEVDSENMEISDGFLIKGETIGDNNWRVVDLDVDNIGLVYGTQSNRAQIISQFIARQIPELHLALARQLEDTDRPDDSLYVVYDRADIEQIISWLQLALSSALMLEVHGVLTATHSPGWHTLDNKLAGK